MFWQKLGTGHGAMGRFNFFKNPYHGNGMIPASHGTAWRQLSMSGTPLKKN
jgi:hypothetical protein